MMLVLNVTISPSRYIHRGAVTIRLLLIQGRRCRGLDFPLWRPEGSAFGLLIFSRFFMLAWHLVKKVAEIREETDIGCR